MKASNGVTLGFSWCLGGSPLYLSLRNRMDQLRDRLELTWGPATSTTKASQGTILHMSTWSRYGLTSARYYIYFYSPCIWCLFTLRSSLSPVDIEWTLPTALCTLYILHQKGMESQRSSTTPVWFSCRIYYLLCVYIRMDWRALSRHSQWKMSLHPIVTLISSRSEKSEKKETLRSSITPEVPMRLFALFSGATFPGLCTFFRWEELALWMLFTLYRVREICSFFSHSLLSSYSFPKKKNPQKKRSRWLKRRKARIKPSPRALAGETRSSGPGNGWSRRASPGRVSEWIVERLGDWRNWNWGNGVWVDSIVKFNRRRVFGGCGGMRKWRGLGWAILLWLTWDPVCKCSSRRGILCIVVPPRPNLGKMYISIH